MDDPKDVALDAAIGALAVAGVSIGHRLISSDDENALLPEEAGAFLASVVAVRRASGAARIVARDLLARLGLPRTPVPRSSTGPPIWPAGIVGSLAHDARVAIAAVARRCDFAAVGIDIEPAEDLPAELMDIVATPAERAMIGKIRFGGRLLFVAKEAAYKAVYPLDHTFLDHHEIEIDFKSRRAAVRTGRIVEMRFCISTHLAALAFIPAAR
ncbi:MAG TPA: 4'-phosphopantetheinyl transferase superfamily protein [Xanthobacteraceae bacterium]|jgi:4'-phosphopantetheinyl transferase EntD|nr:4'-phosphopantetheinyl transferase superfamily protein [Xanthobacteraceae bacterium]